MRIATLCIGLCAAGAHAQSFGGFDDPIDIDPGFLIVDIAAGDLNGDGADDLVIVPLVGAIAQVAISNGDGTFDVSDLTIAAAAGVDAEIVDVDADGALDCVIANQALNGIEVFLGDGAGGLISQGGTDVGMNEPIGLACGHIDDDGLVDLLLTGDDGALPLLNSGAGVFAPLTAIPVTGDFRFPLLADVNDDGFDDAVLPDINSAILYVALNLDALFAVPDEYELSAPSAGAGDLDADGDLDLAVPTVGAIAILHNDGDGAFDPPALVPMVGNGRNIGLSDLEGDGDLDIVVSTFQSAFVYLADGKGGYAEPDELPTLFDDPLLLVMADVTGDLLDDLVLGPSAGILVAAYVNLSIGLPPAPFSLLAPADGATGLALPETANAWGGGAALTWERAAGLNVTYDLVIASDADLEDVIHEQTGLEEPAHLLSEGILASGTTYYWGVVAHNPLGSVSSTPPVASFTTLCDADINGDGVLNILDFVAFQGRFLQGCGL